MKTTTGAGNPTRARPLHPLELAALVQVGAFVLLASWGFGGNAPWSHAAMLWWGSLGGLLTLAAFGDKEARAEGRLRPVRGLWPFALLNGIVLFSLFNPSFREVTMGREVLLVKTGGEHYLPSTVRPALTRDALWLFDGIYLSCFNLVLCVRQRRALRALPLVIGANALVLAVFGSIQKFLGATGLYFGLVKSPQKYFFASFIYHNHWGAFTVLMTALCLGLVFYHGRRRGHRDFWHSPAFAGLVAVFLLAASIPLSTSRSCTLLVLALLGGALLHWAGTTVRQRRARRESAAPPLLAAAVAVLLAGAAAYQLARPIIEQRVAKTREQLAELQAHGGGLGSRMILYQDTWRMARDQPAFGWGLASYPTVFFYFYNTQDSSLDHLPVFYNDAHSDWLQSLAELGFVGTALIGLHGIVPLLTLRRHPRPGPLPGYLFAGCALVLLYAWVEFPFGNPAVVLAWWLCFFTGIRYTRLESQRTKA
jgi:O-antigen ligase